MIPHYNNHNNHKIWGKAHYCSGYGSSVPKADMRCKKIIAKSSHCGYKQVNNISMFVLDAETRTVFAFFYKMNMQVAKASSSIRLSVKFM